MRGLHFFAIAVLVLIQSTPGLAQRYEMDKQGHIVILPLEPRQPKEGEIKISREYGEWSVAFYVGNQTDRLFCVRPYPLIDSYLHDGRVFLLEPYQQHVSAFAHTLTRAINDNTSWSADIRLFVSSVPSVSERPAMPEIKAWSAEERRRLGELCGSVLFPLKQDVWRK